MRLYKNIFHLSFWIVKIAIVFYFFQWPYREMDNFWGTSVFVILSHVLFFYGNYSLLFPRFFERRKYISYGVGLFYLIVLHYILLMWAWSLFKPFDWNAWSAHLDGATGATFIFLSISTGWKLLESWVDSIVKRVKLDKDLKLAELEFLKSQINPHFLFNVLGCINGLALVNSPDTSKAIRNLKELINSSIKMRTGKKVSLAEELSFLMSFISLHQIRYTVPVKLDFPIDDLDEYEIEPMLILPLIENAFKHGDLTETGEIDIQCKLEKGWFYFTISNQVPEMASEKLEGGIGDENVRKRLEYAYSNKHEINTSSENNRYVVHLKMKLKSE